MPSSRNQKQTSSGFTLIELLIVISLLGLLASVILVATNRTRVQARNAKRKDDSFAIRTALQWFYHENGYYPTPGNTNGSNGNGQGNGNNNGNNNGNGSGNRNGNGNGNGSGSGNQTQGRDTAPDADIQNLAGYLVPKYLQTMPNDPKNSPENYMYVWGNSGQDYGLYIPYSNEGDLSCMYITQNGNKDWFGKTMLCGYTN